jgi:hypothetical protein
MCNYTCFSKTLTMKCPDFGIQTRPIKGRCDVGIVTQVFRFPRPVFTRWRSLGISLCVVLWEERVVSIVWSTEFSSSEWNLVTLKMEAARSFRNVGIKPTTWYKTQKVGLLFYQLTLWRKDIGYPKRRRFKGTGTTDNIKNIKENLHYAASA